MKSPLRLLFAAALALLAAGCTTVDPSTAANARIQEKSEAYAKLTPAQKDTIKSGVIERGFTSDMVYMALGQPDKVRTKDAAIGKLEMWTYVILTPAEIAAQNNINHPDAAKYTPMFTSPNAPGGRGGPSYTQPMSFGFGDHYGMQPLSVPDMNTEKLYVFFANGRVAEIKYDKSGI